MAKPAEGVVYASKNPNPKPSPKSFAWPERAAADEKIRQALATSLQELLPKKNWTHVDLGRALFGANEQGQIRRIGVARAWIKAGGPFMTEEEAGWTADLLGVSMQRLLAPKGTFDPNPAMIRPKSKPGEGKTKRAYNRKDAVDPDDQRWVLPHSASPPVFTMASHKDHDGMMAVEFAGTIPQAVAMAIIDMLAYRRETPRG